MIKLLICEDQTLVRQCLSALVGIEAGIAVVGEAVNGRDAVEKVDSLRPDVVLMDIEMPIMDGVEATRIIAGRHPSIRVILLTGYDYDQYVIEGLKAGAAGYMLKDTGCTDLISIIKRVHEGEHFIQPNLASSTLLSRINHSIQNTATL